MPAGIDSWQSITRLRRHEAQGVVATLVLLAVAAVVVWGRLGPCSFTG